VEHREAARGRDAAGRVTVSIRQTLATLPGGRVGVPLSDDELAKYLRDRYDTDGEKKRLAHHRLREELYRDGGCEYMRGVVNEQFEDEKVKERRRRWVPHARFANPTKRIVDEMSTVYSEPAARSVGGADTNNKAFADLADEAQLDDTMDYANRMLNLHRAIVLGPRIRRVAEDRVSLVVDVATPAHTIAVVHPNDATYVIAWIFKVEFRSARTEWPREPKWQLWSDHETMILDESFRPITSEPHGLGVNPWVPVTYSGEAVPGFWPGESGADLVATHTSMWFAHILLLKETKSATKVPFISGDTSSMARSQAMDTETPIEAPEGVSVTTTDMGMDTGAFREMSDFALERTGNGYGLSMAGLTHQGTQSAEARQVMLEPLRQLRRKQVKTFRRAERRLAHVAAAVCKGTPLAFEVVEFKVDFGEPQVLQTEMERQVIFEKKRAAGLANSVDEYKRENPDAASSTDDEILAGPLKRNIEIETARQLMMRAQQAISGTLGGQPEPPPGMDPQTTDAPDADDLSWVEEALLAA
jgi:hypothetical protein